MRDEMLLLSGLVVADVAPAAITGQGGILRVDMHILQMAEELLEVLELDGAVVPQAGLGSELSD